MSNSLWSHGLYSPWNSPSQNTGVGSLSLLRGIFPTQGSNPGLPHCRQILYQLSHKGSPKRGAIMIKSNPIPTRWVTHRLENNNTKEVLPLLWRFWIPHSVEPSLGDSTKGLWIPRESGLEGLQGIITGLPEDWGKQRLQSWKAQTKFCLQQDPEERRSDPTGDWTKTTGYCGKASWGGMGQ